ncbi:MAG: hypothetical protein ISS66_13710 [Desulfobacteraceae bacterium]|nr:hypothetical protein [Desulfobacteraceae bacterium]
MFKISSRCDWFPSINPIFLSPSRRSRWFRAGEGERLGEGLTPTLSLKGEGVYGWSLTSFNPKKNLFRNLCVNPPEADHSAESLVPALGTAGWVTGLSLSMISLVF